MTQQAYAALRPTRPRDPDEAHRAATPLELLFDLVSVIAIASAVAGLHHAIAANHILEGTITFCLVFFPIWWAWMNYTWYASAYDNDDVLFRVLTMVIMAGALCMAAGITQFFHDLELTLIVVGFVIMRIGMVTLWLRAAIHDPQRRVTALLYALGISLAQVYWVWLGLNAPESFILYVMLFVLGALLELSVPVIAERQATTPWHRHHLIERYGLLNIIVLGETLLAGSMALAKVIDSDADVPLVHVALSSLVILLSMWWLYFAREEHLEQRRLACALNWGYGHLLIYLSGAAVGAGFAVLVDIVTGHAEVGLLVGDYAVAIPVAVYFIGLWYVRDRMALSGRSALVLPVCALAILLIPPLLGLEGIAAVALASVVIRSWVCRHCEARSGASTS